MSDNAIQSITVYMAGCEKPSELLENVFELGMYADATLAERLALCRQCREEDELNSASCSLKPIAVTLSISNIQELEGHNG